MEPAGLVRAMARLGLVPMGGFTIEAGDIADPGQSSLAGRQALLVGNAGGAMWEAFSRSPEAGDGSPYPLNRWTRRVVDAAAGSEAAGDETPTCLYPFGEAVWPFQRWAMRAMGIEASPLGMLIHPEYGLWFALRAAVIMPAGAVETLIQEVEKVIHPCRDCLNKPCLSGCPVNAFSDDGFAVSRCRSYLDSTREAGASIAPDCLGQGCAARNACPVGREWRYGEAQLRFHMAAFSGT